MLRGSPWFFGKSFLLLVEVKGLDVPLHVPLGEQAFWVRIHGLPLAFMAKRMGEELGTVMRWLEEVDCRVDGTCVGELMRIKVDIGVFKPLRRGSKFTF
ncbi:hypothetical protein COP2_025440 [Malus domestica]